jgi:hypothetical protein
MASCRVGERVFKPLGYLDTLVGLAATFHPPWSTILEIKIQMRRTVVVTLGVIPTCLRLP